MKKILLLTFAIFSFVVPFYSQSKTSDLTITSDDMYIVAEENGFHLYIRKKDGMESVMLVESSKDPAGKQTNYAYRAKEYNPVNGDEIRYLNGKVLDSKYAKYSLIDSTSEPNEKFGQSFHIYVPEVVVYGYPWARSGEVKVFEGFFVNIRSFSKKYCDYSGKFADNCFNFAPRQARGAVQGQSQGAAQGQAGGVVQEQTSGAAQGQARETVVETPVTDPVEVPEEVEVEISVSVPFGEEIIEETDVPRQAREPEEDVVREPEVEETLEPEDAEELDVVSPVPFNEATAVYTPSKIEKTKRVFDEWEEKTQLSVPDEPFVEQYEPGLKEDPVEKFNRLIEEQEKQQPVSSVEKKEESEKVVVRNPDAWPEKTEKVLSESYDTFGIKMQLVSGNKKIKNLYISQTEVTQNSYQKIIGVNPSTYVAADKPVETVSWYEVLVFCNRLSIKNKLTPCYSINGETNPNLWGATPQENNEDWNNVECNFDANGYRMLTTEEWEFAAAGGIFKQKGPYAGNKNIEAVAWYAENSGDTTHEVGLKSQNSCQLYDMSGNVSEYCFGKSGDKKRKAALRGGNFSYPEKLCKSSFKDSCQPWYRHSENGIRICCLAE